MPPCSGQRHHLGGECAKRLSSRPEGQRIFPPAEVRKAYQKVRPLEKLNIEKRGWTLDVLNVVRSLGKKEFQLAEVYAHADQLAKLHPQNHHINPKIRQQSQELRKLSLIEFLGMAPMSLREPTVTGFKVGSRSCIVLFRSCKIFPPLRSKPS
jgi:hypothetical protein